MNPAPRMLSALLLAAAASALTGCSTPESKVESYSKRGESLLQKGDLVKARLEFQNALQINPSAVRALFGMAQVAERARDWPGTYQLLTKVVELKPDHLQALVKIGKLQLASGQLDKALETANAAQSIKADSPDVLGLRAAVFLKLAEPAKAVSLAREAIALQPNNVDALVVLATERLQAGDGDAGVAMLDKALAFDERNVSLQMLKVQALEKLGRADAAEQVLHTLVRLFPQNTEYRHLLAGFYVSHKLPAKAEAEYRAVVAATPADAAAKLQLVQFIGSSQGADAAAAELQKFSQAEPRAWTLKLALANLRVQQKNDEAAIALWQEIIAKGDDAVALRARGALASYRIMRNDVESAKKLVAEMLAKDARDEQALFLRSGIALDERKLDDAVADLRTILRDTPTSPRAHLLLARAHELQGLRDLSMQHYGNAAQAGRFAPAYALPYAQQLLRTGRGRQAEGVLREVLRVAPGDLPTLKLLAHAHLHSGDFAAAQALADQLAKGQGTEFAARQMQGSVQFARKDFSGGIASLRRAYELAPSDPGAMSTVVRGYLVAGRPKEALSFVQAVANASPSNQVAHVLKGQLLAETGNRQAAIESMQAGIAVNPGNPLGYQALVALHLAAGQPDQAMAVADKGLQAAPGHFDLRLARAGVLDAQGKTDEAIAAYEALLAERPNAVVVANNLASLLADHRKDPASLRRAFDIAQRFRSADIPQLKDTVGWTTHLVGKHSEAASLLKSAAAGAPGLAVVHYHYGMNQLALNNVKNAKEALQRAIDLADASPFRQVDEARKTLQGL